MPEIIAALALAAVHAGGQRLHRPTTVPRDWLLSAGSGISVAYVFLHLLPEVAALEELLGQETAGWWVALGGLALMYGSELLARRTTRDGGRTDLAGWAHLASYAIYNGVVGYLLVEQAHESVTQLTLFAVAMALHFLVNDHSLREHYEGLYQRSGRWLVAGGVLVGTLVGLVTEPAALVLEVTVAVLGGGVILNVLKEELPEDRSSRWLPFVVAGAAYGLLLGVV